MNLNSITKETKIATIALVGQPNVGKSTLINTIIGYKLAIVTPKVQTTRRNLKGVLNSDNTQLVFIDTPGLFEAREDHKLENLIVKNAWKGIKQSDCIAFIFDAIKSFKDPEYKKVESEIISNIKDFLVKYEKGSKSTSNNSKRLIAIVNKIDLLDKTYDKKLNQIPKSYENILDNKESANEEKLLEINNYIESLGIFEKIFHLSATDGLGIDSLIDFLNTSATPGKWLFEDEVYTDSTEREILEELTREQLYLHLHDELPYSLKVETDSWTEQEDGSAIVHQSIYVIKNSQKAILLGKGGSMIKEVGIKTRKMAEEALERKVHLFLYVKVREDWIKHLKEV